MAVIRKLKNGNTTVYPITSVKGLYSSKGDLLDFLGSRSENQTDVFVKAQQVCSLEKTNILH